MNKEIQEQILELTKHNIPFYAYGDNEAACELSRRLNEVASIVSRVEPEVGMPSENSFGQWVDIKDKLPEDKEDVIVCQKNTPQALFANYDKLHGRFLNPAGSADGIHLATTYYMNIIKWMPLPKL